MTVKYTYHCNLCEVRESPAKLYAITSSDGRPFLSDGTFSLTEELSGSVKHICRYCLNGLTEEERQRLISEFGDQQ